MRKGQLVNPLKNRSELKLGPYVVVRAPYEFLAHNVIRGMKVTQARLCVDLLSPDGKIIKGVACDILESA